MQATRGEPLRGARGRRLTQAACAATCAAVLSVAVLLQPDERMLGTHERLGLPPCGFHRVTGLPCPGCGMTTAFAHAVRFQWQRAFLANPFGLVLCVGTALFGVFSVFCLVSGSPAWSWRGWFESPIAIGTVFALLFLSWAFKIAATLLGWQGQ